MSLSKEVSQREQYVSWGGLIDTGKRPEEDDKLKFTGSKGLVYRIGYSATGIYLVSIKRNRLLWSVLF